MYPDIIHYYCRWSWTSLPSGDGAVLCYHYLPGVSLLKKQRPGEQHAHSSWDRRNFDLEEKREKKKDTLKGHHEGKYIFVLSSYHCSSLLASLHNSRIFWSVYVQHMLCFGYCSSKWTVLVNWQNQQEFLGFAASETMLINLLDFACPCWFTN